MKAIVCLLTLLASSLLVARPTSWAAERLIPSDKIRDRKQDGPRLFILAIGVANFNDSFWPALKWSEQDAKRVAATFGDKTHRRRVVSVLTGQQVTRQSIEKELDQIAAQAGRKDAVAIYVSTHGTLALARGNDLEQILVLPQTDSKNVVATGLSIARLRRKLETVLASHKLLMLAACHSGIGKSRLTPAVQEALSGAKGQLESIDDVSEGILVLSAAARGETAREDDRLRGDIYTHYFIEALKSFDRNQDGAVSALEAHDYARDRAYTRSGGKQRATLEAQAIGEVDLILQGRVTRRALPVLEARDDELAGLMIRVDDGVKGRLPTAVALRPNASTVRLYRPADDKPFVSYKVAAPPGTRLELDDIMAGQTWSVGVGTGAPKLHNDNAKQVLDNNLQERGITVGYRLLRSFSLGLEASAINDQRLHLDSEIKANMTWSASKLVGEYNYSTSAGFDTGLGLAMGRQWAKLTLSDSRQDLTYSASTDSISPHLMLGWTSTSGFALRLILRHETGVFDFGEPGHIDTRRSVLMIYGLYRFGGYARRL